MILTWLKEIFLLSSCLLINWLNFQQIRLAALSWNGEGSFLFTSSSAPYDRNDNGPCDEVGLIHLNCQFILLLIIFLFSIFILIEEIMIIPVYIEIDASFPNDSIIHKLLIYPNGTCFILGYSSCANREEPQGWYPSKSWKCGTGIWWLCS